MNDVRLNKVAQVTLLFWIMKICATTLGETAGDLLSLTMNVGYAISSIILLSVFAATLIVQLASRRFHPVVYWAVIVATSTAGTTMPEVMDRTLGLGYAVGSLVLVGCLVTILLIWYAVERTLSVHDIRRPRVECFYWTTILTADEAHRERRTWIRNDRIVVHSRYSARCDPGLYVDESASPNQDNLIAYSFKP